MTNGFEYIEFLSHADPDGDVLEVVINRPGDGSAASMNAVNGTLHHELSQLFRYLNTQPQRAVLLTGKGTAFSAGGDFNWFPTLQDREALEALRVEAKQLIYDLLDVRVPVVCAINGPAVGLGASIALLCDTIFMARSAVIADPHVRVGVVAGDGGTIAWPLAVGPARAKQYLLTGDPISAEEAERIGLVNTVVDDDELHTQALAFAKRLAKGAPLAIQYTKQAVNAGVKARAAEMFDQALAAEIGTFGSADHAEALAAMSERRAPHFRGN